MEIDPVGDIFNSDAFLLGFMPFNWGVDPSQYPNGPLS
tara:strand:+ start:4561 stop:4674 length:114 start_codon:yes stop_codon:yes gene_type:complete